MARKFTILFSALGVLAVVSLVTLPTSAGGYREPAIVDPSGQEVVVPLQAINRASNVFRLGSAIDPTTGEAVEGYAIVHYGKGYAQKSESAVGTQTTCYGFLAEGAKWKVVEPWLVNPANRRGLSSNSVFSILTNGVAKWEDAANTGSASPVDILGTGSITSNRLKADFGMPDGKNEVYFANISSPGAIAITVVWGIFNGDVANRKLVEWDQVYDDRDFNWSAEVTGVVGKMDFDNIATHELGHSVGMNDLYTSSCNEETMYGYADYAEIIKRSLNAGDVLGVSLLY